MQLKFNNKLSEEIRCLECDQSLFELTRLETHMQICTIFNAIANHIVLDFTTLNYRNDWCSELVLKKICIRFFSFFRFFIYKEKTSTQIEDYESRLFEFAFNVFDTPRSISRINTQETNKRECRSQPA